MAEDQRQNQNQELSAEEAQKVTGGHCIIDFENGTIEGGVFKSKELEEAWAAEDREWDRYVSGV